MRQILTGMSSTRAGIKNIWNHFSTVHFLIDKRKRLVLDTKRRSTTSFTSMVMHSQSFQLATPDKATIYHVSTENAWKGELLAITATIQLHSELVVV